MLPGPCQVATGWSFHLFGGGSCRPALQLGESQIFFQKTPVTFSSSSQVVSGKLGQVCRSRIEPIHGPAASGRSLLDDGPTRTPGLAAPFPRSPQVSPCPRCRGCGSHPEPTARLRASQTPFLGWNTCPPLCLAACASPSALRRSPDSQAADRARACLRTRLPTWTIGYPGSAPFTPPAPEPGARGALHTRL